MNILLAILSILLLFHACAGENKRPVVETKNGKISGKLANSRYGAKYLSFLGIPYAKPPIGQLRFRPPEPAEPWEGTKDGSKDGSMCLQYNEIQKGTAGSEDCLFLNVYVSQQNADSKSAGEKKAVMVYIYGGAFMMGSADAKLYGPGLLMEQDVIVVTFNYRLNVFGFLSTGDEVLPGNNGMWDQVLALKWVKENIEAFGGDSDRVTIFGESAGAASVSMHILSSASKGLFQGAIMQSGSAFNPWAIQEDPLTHAKEIASRLDCPTDSSSRILECLKEKPAKDLFETCRKYAVFPAIFPVYFSPVVDSSSKTPFLPEHPHDILTKGTFNRVPTISGVMENEGAFFVLAGELSKYYGQMDKKFYEGQMFEKYVRDISDFKENLPAIVSRLKKEYFADVTDFNDRAQLMGPMQKMASSIFFNVGCSNFAKRLVQHGSNKHYYYEMKYRGKTSLSSFFSKENYGATHGDDIMYVFDGTIMQKLQGKDLETARKMVKLWTNFAQAGVPSIEENEIKWTPVTQDQFGYLEIDQEFIMRQGNPWEKEEKLLSEIITELHTSRSNIKAEL